MLSNCKNLCKKDLSQFSTSTKFLFKNKKPDKRADKSFLKYLFLENGKIEKNYHMNSLVS